MHLQGAYAAFVVRSVNQTTDTRTEVTERINNQAKVL